eukprot:TRINITY_DN16768_c0_g1_i2.p1 TRINITY_DN16768_c0_g1~~TRINITY_DN16768_c0_g1_i2.p1  ORF type:complete len:930 (-),score=165.72 TRINITY_DN16768_c0_g1_i2:63-2552(-)
MIVARTVKRENDAATKIQAMCFRGVRDRRYVVSRLNLVVQLQACCRRRRVRLRLKALRSAAIPLQAAWRRALKRWRVVKRREKAATYIQACVRRWQCSSRGPIQVMRQRRKAGDRIRALGRGFLVRHQNRTRASAAKVIQRKVRLRMFRRAMAEKRKGALVIQKIWRGGIHRAALAKRLEDNGRVAACIRGYIERNGVLKERNGAATVIQRITRGGWGREEATYPPLAAVMIQAAWRGFAQRRKYRRSALFKLVGLICAWRYKKTARELIRMRVKLRRAVRYFLPRHRLNHIRKKAICIQRMQRACAERRRQRRWHAAAAKLQALSRRQKGNAAAEARLKAMLVIQAYTLRRWYARVREHVVAIQKIARGMIARVQMSEKRNAATRIAKVFRAGVCRTILARRRKASIAISRKVRAWLVRLHHGRRCKAADFILRSWRRYRGRARARERLAAATKLAAAWRACRGRRLHARVRQAGSVIVCGAWMWKHSLERLERHRNASRITAAWRGYCVRQNMAKLRSSTDKIKRFWRNHVAMREAIADIMEISRIKRQMMIERMLPPVLMIQRAVRRWILKRGSFRKFRAAIVRLQARFRGYMDRRRVSLFRLLVGTRVSRMPSRLLALAADGQGRLTRCRPFKTKEKAVAKTARLVQVKGLSETLLEELTEPVRLLQAYQRAKRRRSAALRIQALMRGALARKRLRTRRAAAVRVEAIARSWLARALLRRAKAAAVEIQAASRGALVRWRIQRQGAAAVSAAADVPADVPADPASADAPADAPADADGADGADGADDGAEVADDVVAVDATAPAGASQEAAAAGADAGAETARPE